MKRITLFLLVGLLSFSFNNAQAQTENKIELAPVVGYQFGGKVKYYEGEFRMDNAMNYGVYLNVLASQNHRVELSYSLMKTEAHFRPYGSYLGDYRNWDGDVNIHYVLIGSHSEMPVSEKLTLFGGISLGATILGVQDASVSDVWRFGLGVSGGLKIALSDRIGIRMQGRLLMPMYFAGVGFYAGVGTGGASSGLSMNAGVVAFQGDFQGGLYFGF
ncbi:MAG: hypothetical protein KAG64_08575 [Bacteroidales bacterium]|nr:hypothetical protein [Bacteroidales bacterium]